MEIQGYCFKSGKDLNNWHFEHNPLLRNVVALKIFVNKWMYWLRSKYKSIDNFVLNTIDIDKNTFCGSGETRIESWILIFVKNRRKWHSRTTQNHKEFGERAKNEFHRVKPMELSYEALSGPAGSIQTAHYTRHPLARSAISALSHRTIKTFHFHILRQR